MAYCLDCHSVYSQPGTCNCFAPGGARDPAKNVVTTTVTHPAWRRCYYCGQVVTDNVVHFCGSSVVPLRGTGYVSPPLSGGIGQ